VKNNGRKTNYISSGASAEDDDTLNFSQVFLRHG
jgi:hypothetical protein